jgi:hypothetical protein
VHAANADPGRGAYGLRLPDLDRLGAALPAASDDWPAWSLTWVQGEAPTGDAIEESRASLAFGEAGSIAVDCKRASVTITSPVRPTDAELVHPCLGAIAAVASRWLGRQSFHAGAVLAAGGAWGVLGGAGSGKSTLLAALAAANTAVIGDDLLVVGDGLALAGPRCVDLRADAAATLGVGERIGVVGARDRWRVALGAVPAAAPLRGWVALDWAPQPAIKALAPPDRLPRLLDAIAIVPAPEVDELLDLATLPMYVLERPRDLGVLGSVLDELLEAIAR